jgi:hypothetical protein
MAAIDDVKTAINSLNLLLDSDAYMKMLNDPNTSAQDENLLNSAFSRRNQLTQNLLDVYAAKIDQATPQFATLLASMQKINAAATDATSTLQGYTARVQLAVQVASFLDEAIKNAMALGI